ncbi:MAG TPA: DUF4956 domain-containing protein [Gemmatimonadales bacterium]|nr:DUF4956 domain-containing protein [Gemmatimonadales bacterium]
MEKRPGVLAWFDRHQVLKIFGYYALLAALLVVVYQIRPNLQGVFSTEQFQASIVGIKKGDLLGGGAVPAGALDLTPVDVAVDALIMMLSSVLLMLPVAWVFILTRSRKGFSQSTVQTLIFLPLVVAGVMMLVQHSTALAFGLGGVVGAVSFRNRLEDPKDAIYIFVAIAVGLAAGVQVLSVAAAISIFFNLVVLYAWRFDFGRMPATLEVDIAKKRMDRVKAAGAPKADFLNLVDQQLLRSMTPDQLQAIAQKATERGRKAAVDLDVDGELGGESDEEKKAKFDSMLRIYMQPDDAVAVRQAVEQVLTGQTKRWEFERVGAGEGGRAMAMYKVKFKKSIPSTLVVEAMRRSVLPKVVTIDVRDA